MKSLLRFFKNLALAVVVVPSLISITAFAASFFIPAGTFLPSERANLDRDVKMISAFYESDKVPENVDHTLVMGRYTGGTVRA